MGLTYEEAVRAGVAGLHPDHGGGGVTPKRSKYRAVRTVYNGVAYPSKAEAARAATLDLWAASSPGRWWVGQPTFRLGCPENIYRADFLVVSPEGVHVEDVKGVETAKFKRDVRLWRAYGPCDLHVIKGKQTEIVTPEPRNA